jgi:hypothetical protein
MKIKYMKIETIPDFYIQVIADSGKQLVNGETRVKEISVPLDGDYSMWAEEDEIIEDIPTS